MRHGLLIFPLLMTCTILFGCSTHSPYPDQWPKLLERPGNGCNAIFGVYSDRDIKSIYSLANIFINHSSSYGYFEGATYIIFVQSDRAIEVTVKNSLDATIRGKTLAIGKDVLCTKDGFQISPGWGHFVFQEGVIGYEGVDFNFLMSEDGSLILQVTEWGFGSYGIFPFAASQGKYYRFQKFPSR